MGKNKNIKIGREVNPNSSRQPKHSKDPESYFDKSPSWCFSKCDFEYTKWSIDNIDFSAEILPKQISFERRKLSDIVDDDKHNHWISINDFSKEAQKRAAELPQLGDELFSLRLTSTLRLFGFIENGVYYIIWVDKDHEVCPSKQRHT